MLFRERTTKNVKVFMSEEANTLPEEYKKAFA